MFKFIRERDAYQKQQYDSSWPVIPMRFFFFFLFWLKTSRWRLRISCSNNSCTHAVGEDLDRLIKIRQLEKILIVWLRSDHRILIRLSKPSPTAWVHGVLLQAILIILLWLKKKQIIINKIKTKNNWTCVKNRTKEEQVEEEENLLSTVDHHRCYHSNNGG
jgi:hypothetical protein